MKQEVNEANVVSRKTFVYEFQNGKITLVAKRAVWYQFSLNPQLIYPASVRVVENRLDNYSRRKGSESGIAFIRPRRYGLVTTGS